LGFAAIYLKNAFSVKAHFYIHTDWVMFARKVLNIDTPNLSHFRRLLRAYYSSFDSLFVLNSDQQKWLTGKSMGFDTEKVHLTAHWVDDQFSPIAADKEKVFGFDPDNFIILFSGRLSQEKGVLELPEIYNHINSAFPKVKMVIAGTGPAEDELKKRLPDAIYLGWVDHNRLPEIYASSDILILPSKFDTFSCSVLEAISCGLPVIAYNIKGPKDIINDMDNGFLVSNIEELKARLSGFIANPEIRKSFKEKALKRAQDYKKDLILNKLLFDIGLQ
jgi:glycosyltransferase involved in cell wall biosynthesis